MEQVKPKVKTFEEIEDLIYSYKSVIPVLTQVKKGELSPEKELELYKENYEKLYPQVQKMREVYLWFETILETLKEKLNSVKFQEEECKEEDLSQLTEILDSILVVDFLKAFQAGFNNDFSMYRRIVLQVKEDYDMVEDESLRGFLVNSNNMMKTMRKQFDSLPNFHLLAVALIKYCTDKFEQTDANGSSSRRNRSNSTIQQQQQQEQQGSSSGHIVTQVNLVSGMPTSASVGDIAGTANSATSDGNTTTNSTVNSTADSTTTATSSTSTITLKNDAIIKANTINSNSTTTTITTNSTTSTSNNNSSTFIAGNDKYLRVIVLCIYFLDGVLLKPEIYNELKKKIKLSKTQKLFKEHPKINLYRELPFNVQNFIKNCGNFQKRSEASEFNCQLL